MFRVAAVAFGITYLVGASVWVLSAGVVRDGGDRVELLNVACDPTRELWRDINARFIEKYRQQTGVEVTVLQSHGGSGSQARAVIDGNDADVVTLALWTDTDAIRKAGRIDAGWEDRLPNKSLPYTSTIVFLVRAGNPKNLHDWPDLARPDVSVITPNPKTSGNGKWSLLAAWGSVVTRGGSDADATDYLTRLYQRVPVLDTAARAASMTFSDKKIGDVLLTWENEALLDQAKHPELDIVYPPVSVLAEPHVAVVDAVVNRKGTRQVAEEYLKYLYTEEAQQVIADHHHRPINPIVRARNAAKFHAIDLFPARKLGPSWDEIQQRFFAEGGMFDRVLAAGRSR